MSQHDDKMNAIEQPAGAPLVAPVDARQVDEQRRQTYQSYEAFLRRHLEELDRTRPGRWQRDYSSQQAYLRSVEPMRARLKQMLGWWVEPADRPEIRTSEPQILLEHAEFSARRFRFEVLPGLESYAVELIPRRPNGLGLLAQHGYGGTPELVCGFTPTTNDADYAYRSLGIRAARRGYHVIAVHHPSGHGTAEDVCGTLPDFPSHTWAYGKNRLHRLAVLCGGRTLFGLDMMASSRGVDLLLARGVRQVGMYGLSQGGTSALFLPALDTRVQATVCSAYFNHRLPKLIGPHRSTSYLDSHEEDKFFTDVIGCFADSDLASLICPRAFAVEAGQGDTSVDFEKSRREYQQAREHYQRLKLENRTRFIGHAEGHVSATAAAFEFLQDQLQEQP